MNYKTCYLDLEFHLNDSMFYLKASRSMTIFDIVWRLST